MTKELLKSQRTKLGLTLLQVAQAVGVSEATVSRWESGDIANMKRNHIAALAKILRLRPSVLVGINDDETSAQIPVLGNVPAGTPVEAVQDIIDYEDIPAEWAKKGVYFGLKIKGDSMLPRICEGDVVIVQKTAVVKNGDIVIALVNGYEATCKKYKKTEEGVMLLPLNQDYEPLFFSNKEVKKLPVKILGKVIELRGKFN